MQYARLGTTDIKVSRIAFGAGPIPGLLTGADEDLQCRTVQRALESGINWFDTAATYGDGTSEASLGRALTAIGGSHPWHIASKVRVMPDQLADIAGTVERSVHASLERLQQSAVTLIQLHNSITPRRGDLPTSLSPHDVLGPGGVLEALQSLRNQGLIRHLGMTGIGHPACLRQVIASGGFDTMQVPYNLLNSSAGRDVDTEFTDTNYGNTIGACRDQSMGVFAIRVFAGGAVFRQPPSPHTLKTKFFPLELYRQDCSVAELLETQLGAPLADWALRYSLAHTGVSSSIVGFSSPDQVDLAVASSESAALSDEMVSQIDAQVARLRSS